MTEETNDQAEEVRLRKERAGSLVTQIACRFSLRSQENAVIDVYKLLISAFEREYERGLQEGLSYERDEVR